MNFIDILEIKKLYTEFLLTEDLKDKDKMMLYYLDLGADVELLELINEFVLLDTMKFIESLEFQAYLMGFNLTYEYIIPKTEMMSVDIILLELDDDGCVMIKEDNELEKFETYKKKYL